MKDLLGEAGRRAVINALPHNLWPQTWYQELVVLAAPGTIPELAIPQNTKPLQYGGFLLRHLKTSGWWEDAAA